MTEAPADLFAAIQANDADAALAALDRDPSQASATNEQGVTALMWALYHRQQGIADAVAARRAEAGAPLDLHEAAAMGDLNRVRELLESSDVTAVSADGFTPLHFAAFFGREDTVPVLLEAGAPVAVAAGNPSAVHPLHSAAAIGSVAICRMLLEAGADVDAQQHGGYTPLMSASLHGNGPLVELLLEHGASRELQSDDGKTAADMARDGGHEEVAGRLGSG